MKIGLAFLLFCVYYIICIKADKWAFNEDSTAVATTTMSAIKSRQLMKQMRQDMRRMKVEHEPLAVRMKRRRCERLGRNFATLRGRRLDFYTKFCLNADPTEVPPKDYDYSFDVRFGDDDERA